MYQCKKRPLGAAFFCVKFTKNFLFYIDNPHKKRYNIVWIFIMNIYKESIYGSITSNFAGTAPRCRFCIG